MIDAFVSLRPKMIFQYFSFSSPKSYFILQFQYFFSRIQVLSFPITSTRAASIRPLLTSADRPDPDDKAPFARWLVSQNSWGVLNTLSSEYGGSPFGNVSSFSDDLPNKGKGIPYFYLTTLDPTTSNALKDQSKRAQFWWTEGVLVKEKSKEVEFAKTALFVKHLEMEHWPKGHNFQIYKLDIENTFMINWFGGPKPLTVEQYLKVRMNELTTFDDSTA